MFKKTDLTVDQVRELFNYDTDTGSLIWRKPYGTKTKPGSPAGCKNDLGYLKVKINYKDYKVHRVIWLYVYGTFPPDGFHIDHINWDKTDNRISNLRLLTYSENGKHRKPRGVRVEP